MARGFRELAMVRHYTKNCIYPYIDFQRLSQTDERQTIAATRHDLHRDMQRRLDLSLNAAGRTTNKNSQPRHFINGKHFYKHPSITVWLRADKERQREIRMYRLPLSFFCSLEPENSDVKGKYADGSLQYVATEVAAVVFIIGDNNVVEGEDIEGENKDIKGILR